MTKVSRIRLDARHLGFFINNFWNLITLLENKDQVKNFLHNLLTHTEMKMLAKGVQIAKMLMEGYNYQTIRNFVKVTDSTISRINNLLETGGEGIRAAIVHLQKIEKKIDNERMRIGPNLKKIYGMYYLPDKIIDAVGMKMKARNKKKSVKRSL